MFFIIPFTCQVQNVLKGFHHETASANKVPQITPTLPHVEVGRPDF